MSNISDAAYRFAFAIYLSFAAYLFYFFHSIGLFLAQHYIPESPTGFSTANPNFSMLNNSIAVVLTVVGLVFLFANKKLKEYVVDVGDELTRVSWADFKQTQRATMVVIGLVIVSGLFLFIVDLIFMRAVNALMATAA